MQKNTAQYNEMIQAIAAGLITRQDACTKYGVEYATLGVWLSREGVKTGRKLSGAAAENSSKLTPDKVAALESATAKVMSGEMTVGEAARADPLVNMGTLRLRVAQAKKRAGIPKGAHPGKPRTVAQAVEAVKQARAALAKAEADLEVFLTPS